RISSGSNIVGSTSGTSARKRHTMRSRRLSRLRNESQYLRLSSFVNTATLSRVCQLTTHHTFTPITSSSATHRSNPRQRPSSNRQEACRVDPQPSVLLNRRNLNTLHHINRNDLVSLWCG